jgi:hypothetical protein
VQETLLEKGATNGADCATACESDSESQAATATLSRIGQGKNTASYIPWDGYSFLLIDVSSMLWVILYTR